MPKESKYPELFPGQYDETLFPVDTPNIIPTPSLAADFKQVPEPKGNAKPETDDLDLSSLLSLSAPANDDSDVGNLHMFDNDPLNLFGLQPSLDSLEMLMPTGAESNLPDGIPYWNGFQKDKAISHAPAQPDMSANLGFYGVPFEDQNVIPMDIPTANPVNMDNMLISPLENVVSPKSDLSSPVSGDSTVPSNSPVSSENWQHSLQDLFEQTFDPSDLQGEYMFPPPNKRQEYSVTDMQCAPIKYEVPSPTPSSPMEDSPAPDTIIATSPFSRDQSTKKGKPSSKDKPKHILLFGKDEGEIIRKLLTAKNSLPNKPLTRDKLITMPVEEFNQLLEEAVLTEIEVAFMKEWRRRGKNKAAAQVARKRKREEVSELDEEVHMLRQQKVELEKRYDRLRSLVESLKERSLAAEDMLFQKQSKVLMEPVSRNTHRIHIMDDEKLLLIPRVSSKILLMNQ